MNNSTIDTSVITDLTQLKALAYDQIVATEQAQSNLHVINKRMAELNSAATTPAINSSEPETTTVDAASESAVADAADA